MPRNQNQRQPLSPQQREEQAKVTPDDIQRAAEAWRAKAPNKFRDLLDSQAE